MPVAGDQASERDRSQKRARKRADKESKKADKKTANDKDAKSEKKSSKGRRDAGLAAPVLAEAPTPESRAEKKAARKAEKGKSEKKAERAAKKEERKSKVAAEGAGRAGDSADADSGRAAKKAAKAARKAERKGAKSGDEDSDDDSLSLSINLTGLSESATAGLHQALERKLEGVTLERAVPEKKCDLALYAFDQAPGGDEIAQRAGAIVEEKARVKIFLERTHSPAGSLEEENRAIASLAGACGAPLIRLGSKFRRYGDKVMLSDGDLTQAGYDLIADSILGILAVELPKRSLPRPAQQTAPDLIEARALAASASELLAQLRWKESIAPKLLWTHASKEAMEALVDEKLVLPSDQMFGLRAPIAWPQEISDRATESQILGLEFLTGPFAYWYSKAGGRSNEQIAEIDALLKERGVKASEILSRAEVVMADFAGNYPAASTSNAWQEKAVSRRARVFTLYVLCCKMALKRHIRFNTEAFTLVFRNLLDLIELLRADDFYRPASFEGFQQDCLLIGLGLALRGTVYGDRVLTESLERFLTLQLGVGLTADGVWRSGSFSDHCSLLSTLKTFMGDFDKSDSSLIEPFAAAAKKMTVFAEALLKSNGHPPAIDGSKQKSYAGKLSGTRRVLAQAGGKNIRKSQIASMPRITDTYVFRDAQYFISHSTQKVSEESSLAVLHADSPSLVEGDPGGVTLVFARGETDLIVRAEPPEREKKKDRVPLFDPALRNGYHVNGAGFVAGSEVPQNAARIVKSWRGPGWAAARSIDEINAAASVGRIAIHLKDAHALIVVDQLQSRDGSEAEFEQFWHVAPGLAARPSSDGALRFASPDGGMTVAFDTQGAVAVEAEGEGSCIRRSARLASGVLASLFQWTLAPGPAAIKITEAESGGWIVAASGAGFDVRLVLAGDDLRYEDACHG
jgi:hypothetical protein